MGQTTQIRTHRQKGTVMATDTPNTRRDTLPQGTWSVDPTQSELGFSAKGMFGLATVKGGFGSYEGELKVGADGANGELRITASSLDTRNPRRDKHLQSADFFEVDRYPVVTFTLTDIEPASDGTLKGTGVLQIRDNRLQITTPLDVTQHDEHLHLATEVSVDRAAAGVGWSKLGMIKGPANLHARLALVRQP